MHRLQACRPGCRSTRTSWRCSAPSASPPCSRRRRRAADVAGGASTGAVALLFFLYGARLSTREALDGAQALAAAPAPCSPAPSSLFPLLGLAARGLVPCVLTPPALHRPALPVPVPSTIQSSIAFTSIARGNVPAAICAGSFSSLVGILAHPAARRPLLLGSSGGGFSADSLLKIVLQLLVPFLAGQLLRRWIGGFITRHKKVLGLVDRGSILLVVYTAFSEGMVARHLAPGQPRAGSARCSRVEAVLLAADARAHLVRRQGGSASAGRTGSRSSSPARRRAWPPDCRWRACCSARRPRLAVLPLMLFHQMQLMVCAVIAKPPPRDAGAGAGAGAGGGRRNRRRGRSGTRAPPSGTALTRV